MGTGQSVDLVANELANELIGTGRNGLDLAGLVDYVCPGQTAFIATRWIWPDGFGLPPNVAARRRRSPAHRVDERHAAPSR